MAALFFCDNPSMSVPYRIRVHPRARHVRLRIDPLQGVLVTVPAAFDQRQLPNLIERKRAWIESVRARHASRRQHIDPALLGPRPQRIDLPAPGLSRPVRYQRSRRSTLGFSADEHGLTVRLPQQDLPWIDERLAARLQGWLFEQARSFLPQMVDEVSRAFGLRHHGVTVRNQRARWGSCSGAGRISLNARLLFASAEACRYVVVHELVHTEHPDHSRRFWNRVAELHPDYRQAMAELDAVWQTLPDWL